jgi:hypothetical protein
MMQRCGRGSRDLTKALRLAGELEDDAILRRLAAQK